MSKQTLAVELPGTPVYVTGTVNGVRVVWTLADGVWQATAKRAKDDRYQLQLTAYDQAGNRADYGAVLRCGLLGLITDRTRADLERLKGLYARGWENLTPQEQAWILDEDQIKRGAYGVPDCKRVGQAVTYLAQWFERDGYTVNVQPKPDWTWEDIQRKPQMSRYLADVQALRDRLQGTTPLPDSMDKLDWQGANHIEEALLETQDSLLRLEQGYVYAGEMFSGQW